MSDKKTSDEERFWFLQELDESDIDVSKWEADFIESQLQRGEGCRFTEPQRNSIDQMVSRYGSRII